MSVADPIRVQGLKEFNKQLRELDKGLPKATRLALNEAAELVVDYARPRIPKRSGRAARSVRAASTRKAVRVSGGGRRAPYYPWLDFGGRVGRARSVERKFYKDGRYIYDGYFKLSASGDFQDTLSRSLVKVAEQAGFEVD